LSFQEIYKKQAGDNGRRRGNDQGSRPALRENEFDQKANKKEGGPGKSQEIEYEIIKDQGKEGRQDPFPGIRLREKRRADGAFSSYILQKKGYGHNRNRQARPERQKTWPWFIPSSDLHAPGVEGKKSSDDQEEDRGNSIILALRSFHDSKSFFSGIPLKMNWGLILNSFFPSVNLTIVYII
jgi:hypothetical protein